MFYFLRTGWHAMLEFLKKFSPKSLCIDMGTANTRIIGESGYIVLDEPSVVSYRVSNPVLPRESHSSRHNLAALVTSSGAVSCVRPLQGGVIVDLVIAKDMLTRFIRKSKSKRTWLDQFLSRTIVCIPSNATQVEIRAFKQVLNRIQTSRIYLLYAPMAAALGAGLPVLEPKGSVVLHLGAGATEVGLISLSSLIYKNSIPLGGDGLNFAIVEYIKRQYNVLIGNDVAEQIKLSIGSAYPLPNRKEIVVSGRRIEGGSILSFTINSSEALEALSAPLAQIASFLKDALAHVPPDLSSDVVDSGIVLTGGGALLPGMASMLSRVTGLRVSVAKDPMRCAAKGCYTASQLSAHHSLLRQ
jgi:rod shape-determining protein MreB